MRNNGDCAEFVIFFGSFPASFVFDSRVCRIKVLKRPPRQRRQVIVSEVPGTGEGKPNQNKTHWLKTV